MNVIRSSDICTALCFRNIEIEIPTVVYSRSSQPFFPLHSYPLSLSRETVENHVVRVCREISRSWRSPPRLSRSRGEGTTTRLTQTARKLAREARTCPRRKITTCQFRDCPRPEVRFGKLQQPSRGYKSGRKLCSFAWQRCVSRRPEKLYTQKPPTTTSKG